ncbi:Ldh family oxidoreductase [Halomonas denitrificans]|uniref:Ldh family oxidoreductase n=1 Tax=Halomonas denitrificans TaxID=370769 RepID=UPI00296AED41|nr:Ldh family oxidoreductase [Halomonas denitrificans]
MQDTNAASSEGTYLTREAMMSLCCSVLAQHGFSAAQAEALGATLVAAQWDACQSHGLYRLLGIAATVREGAAVADAQPRVEDLAPAVVRVDADGGFSPAAFNLGLPPLIDKARQGGIAVMAIQRCVHATALWVELEQLTEAGLVAIACNPTQAYMAPHGGKRPLFGTNPLAFGWPRQGQPPLIFDFATSAIARGDIELHRRSGDAIPEGWGVDRHGQPCTDPAEVLDHGAMLPFGGHKGSALALMVELIAGPMIGDLMSLESTDHDDGRGGLPFHGELIIAIDPARTGAGAADMGRAEQLFEQMLGQGARLPAQRRYQERARSAQRGAWVSQALLDDIHALMNS